jgi:sugar transferase (PEP-CTERM/EpsH1 system associated)
MDHRPLIAHVVYRFDMGGLENGVVNLINRLPADKYRHAIVALTQITDFRARIARDDIQYIALEKPPGQGLLQAPKLIETFRRLKPAIVHTRNIGALEATFPAVLAGVPARVHGEHGWDSADPDGKNWKYRLTRIAHRPAVHRWIALSQHIEDYLRKSVGIPQAAIARICNGVDTELFHPTRSGRREPIDGSPFNDPSLYVVGTVGRLQTVKDQVNLVRAVAHAVRQSPDARLRMRLAVVGDGPQRAEVEGAIVEAGLGPRTWLSGARGDVPDVLRGFDCFVLPSMAEGISNTILESMACGLPIIATRVGGNGELIENGVTGRLVPASEPAALGDALLAMMADSAAARRLADDARRSAVRRFSLERMVGDYCSVYDQLLARARQPLLGALSRPEQ